MANLTINGVELQQSDYVNSFDNKKYFEYFSPINTQTKMFISQSLKTGKNLKISAYIDGVNFKLSEKYDIGMALHTFTDLISKFSSENLEVSK